MSEWIQKIRAFPDKLDFCIQLGLLFWIAIIEVLDAGASWATYFSFSSALCLSQLPVLVFMWKKEDLKKHLPSKKYRSYWLACFAIYVPLLAAGSSLMLDAKTIIWEIVLMGAVCTLCLELLLLTNQYFTRQAATMEWVRRLSLDKAILTSITFIAVILAAMAVSSLGNPKYETRQQLLIGFEFDPAKILFRFGTFVSYSAQLLFMYLCGYFFYLINSRILVPNVLKNKGVLHYVLATLAVIGICYPWIGEILLQLPFNKQLGGIFSTNPFSWENAFGALSILLISLPVLLAANWSKQNTLIVSLEKEKAQAELDLLKQQLNPHFFFNTLNNLYALSLQNSKETPEVILQLADLMRYVIYKSREPAVRISDEVKYLRDYLQLQSIRLKEKFDLRFETDIANQNFKVAPLLLIVPIENALKHGIEAASGDGFLHINVKTEDRILHFTCLNSFEQEGKNQTGIGLANLQKRLHLLYPGKHRLQIEKGNTTFRLELELENDEDAMPDR